MKINRRDIAALAVFAALIIAFMLFVGSINQTENRNETEMVRNAIKNAALTCYAVEGFYPLDLSYLRENYGLAYNEDVYVVFYDAFASNLIPDIKVVERGGSAL